jgi:hypothetical protein
MALLPNPLVLRIPVLLVAILVAPAAARGQAGAESAADRPGIGTLSTADLQIVGADEVGMTLREYLNGNDVGVREVVAVDVAGGAVTLYVDEPEVEVGVERTMR